MQKKVLIVNGVNFPTDRPEKIQMIKALRVDPRKPGANCIGLKVAKDFIDWVFANGTDGHTYSVADTNGAIGTVTVALVFEVGSVVKLTDTGKLAMVRPKAPRTMVEHIEIMPLGEAFAEQYPTNMVRYMEGPCSKLATQFTDLHCTLTGGF